MAKLSCVVLHSGGMDSSICLKLAIDQFGPDNVISLGFDYAQRHSSERRSAAAIAKEWGVYRDELKVDIIADLTTNSLVDKNLAVNVQGKPINTLVVGRNGLFCILAALYASKRSCYLLSTGIIGVEGSFSGYRDCSREYMDKVEELLRLDLAVAEFKIMTPIVAMSKGETLELAHKLGVLDYLLEVTVTCYEGLSQLGCGKCPSCLLREKGIIEFAKKHPSYLFKEPYKKYSYLG